MTSLSPSSEERINELRLVDINTLALEEKKLSMDIAISLATNVVSAPDPIRIRTLASSRATALRRVGNECVIKRFSLSMNLTNSSKAILRRKRHSQEPKQ